MRVMTLAALAAATALAMPAMAAVQFNVTAGVPVVAIPNNNNFKTQLAGLGLTHYTSSGATISLSGNATVKFEYIGSESGFRNKFGAGGLSGVSFQEMVNGIDPWNAAGTPIGAGSLSYASGAVTDWFFSHPGQGTIQGPFGIGTAQFGIFMPSTSSFSSAVLYLGFDDLPGSDDDNHDDMIIRVTAEGIGGQGVVPEPASWAMLIAGFGLVGAVSRRRRGATSVSA